MSILHIVPAQTGRVLDLMKIIHRRVPNTDHQFMTMISKNNLIKNCPQLLAIPDIITLDINGYFKRIKKSIFIFRKLKNADHIIWHSFPTTTGIPIALLFFFPFLCKKSTWIVQGDDVNSWPTMGGKIKSFFYNHIQRTIRKKISNIGVIFESDKEALARLGYAKDKIWHTPYPIKSILVESYNNLKSKNNTKSSIYIQLGMNSQQFNNHLEYINKLSEYKNERIRLILPMDYYYFENHINRDTEIYKTKVSKSLESVFPNKSFILNKQVKVEAYANFLRKVQIAIFNNYSTIIYPWLVIDYLKAGKKVFLPSNSPLYEYLKECGATVFPSESIGIIDFKEFSTLPESVVVPHKLDLYYNEDYIINEWGKFVNAINKKERK